MSGLDTFESVKRGNNQQSLSSCRYWTNCIVKPKKVISRCLAVSIRQNSDLYLLNQETVISRCLAVSIRQNSDLLNQGTVIYHCTVTSPSQFSQFVIFKSLNR